MEKTLTIHNDILDKDIELKMFIRDKQTAKLGVCYECLENLLINEMPPELEVNYTLDIISANPDYAAAKCEITDIRGRHAFGCGDVSINNTKFLNEDQKQFALEHPITLAVQTAISAAVTKYLNLQRSYDDENPEPEYSGTSEISDASDDTVYPDEVDDTENASTDESTSDTGGFEDIPDVEDENVLDETDTLTDDEANEYGLPFTTPEPVHHDDIKSEIESAMTTPTDEKKKSDNAKSKYSDFVIPSGKYKGKTCQQVWDTEKDHAKSWFGYIMGYNNGRSSETWKNVIEFAKDMGVDPKANK